METTPELDLHEEIFLSNKFYSINSKPNEMKQNIKECEILKNTL